MDRAALSQALDVAAQLVRDVNVEKGWRKAEPSFGRGRSFGEDVALLHSEVSEMLEAYREWGCLDPTEDGGKPEGIGSEMADVLIRLLDMAFEYQVNLGEEFWRKVDFNATRSFRHGGKLL